MPQIHALVDEGLGNSSYVVDLGEGRALVVDPSRDPAPYMKTAEAHGLQIAFAAETHLHADFISGSVELAACGATVLGSAIGGREFRHKGLTDADEIDLGGLRLRAIATPGHTPEHLAYLLLDGSRPVALFTPSPASSRNFGSWASSCMRAPPVFPSTAWSRRRTPTDSWAPPPR